MQYFRQLHWLGVLQVRNSCKNQHVFDNLKLRGGWGRVGNQSIDNSAYQSTISSADYVLGSNSTV